MNETSPPRQLQSTLVTDRLAVVALALFTVYLSSVVAAVLPPRQLDPLWQLRSSQVLVEAAPVPLLGLALLHLAAYLNPANQRLQRQRQVVARLAIAASLGFLLIVPLQGHAVWTSYRRSNATAERQQATASQKAEALRTMIQGATSAADLQRGLLAQQRPDLRGRQASPSLPALPLPVLKRQLLAQLDQAEGQYKARFAPIDAATAERITRESLRVMVASLAFAVAFAACAQRQHSAVPFLAEWRDLPGRLLAPFRPRQARSGVARVAGGFRPSAARAEEEFLASLAPAEEEHSPIP